MWHAQQTHTYVALIQGHGQQHTHTDVALLQGLGSTHPPTWERTPRHGCKAEKDVGGDVQADAAVLQVINSFCEGILFEGKRAHHCAQCEGMDAKLKGRMWDRAFTQCCRT
eukprot:1156538-Pelagomonas_calceolata.AAC.2